MKMKSGIFIGMVLGATGSLFLLQNEKVKKAIKNMK